MSRFHQFDIPDLPERAFQSLGGKGAWAAPMTFEGAKGSSAPPPDPRLVEAQIKSMGFQDDMIQMIIGNSERMQPLQEEQMRFGLDAARQAQLEARDDRQWMLDRRDMLGGLQDTMVQDARSFNTEDRRAQLAAQAAGDVNQAFGVQRGITNRDMARMGVNPNDGRFAAMNRQTEIAAAAAQASATNKVREAARMEGYGLTDRAANALAGYPAMGMQATGSAAQFGMAGLGLANQGLAGMNSGFGAASGMAGQMGQNATSMYDAQGRYQIGMENAAAGDSLGGILGGLGGLAAGGAQAGWWSDPRLKQKVVEVGMDEPTGLTLYEFEYKAMPGVRWRGVMADEVAEMHPHAVHIDESGYACVDYTALGIPLVQLQAAA